MLGLFIFAGLIGFISLSVSLCVASMIEPPTKPANESLERYIAKNHSY